MKTLNQMVGEKIKEAREGKGYSLRDVENLIDKSYSTIYKYETGERPMKIEDLELICNLYGVNYIELLQEVYYLRKFQENKE